ncbi:hypothetical protein [Thermus albus]|uniref:hypothetical protein n=1 Tax=Thermus albus TaxID=2908146 RepID=UPI001FA9B8B3|nr:hypothetical protein [Thermus albus]
MNPPRVLGYGLDTLVVNLYWPAGKYQLPEGFEATLNELKDLYRRDPNGAILWGVDAYFPLPNPVPDLPWGLEGDLFEAAIVQPTRHYAWQLSFGGLVFVRLSAVKDTTRRAEFPAMRVEFTGTYMRYADRDAEKVVRWVLDAAENLTGTRPHRVQVSRADLFVDVEANPLQVTDIDRFTSRSRVRGVYSFGVDPGREAGATPEGGLMSNTPPATRLRVADSLAEGVETTAAFLRGRDWSGFTFGRGPLMARVYSKTVEARSKYETRNLLMMYEERHGPLTGHVIRVEFQLTTDVLREMVVVGDGSDIRDWDTFRWAIPAIWAYLTGEWLVLRDKARVDAYNRLRDVPVDPLWQVVQGAFNEGGDRGKGELVRDRVFRRVDPVALAKQALGAFMTALAAVGRIDRVDLKSWWIGAFRALGRDKEEREWLGREGALAYGRARLRKMAVFGVMPEKWRFEGV